MRQLHVAFELESGGLELVRVGALFRDQRGRARQRDVRNGIVQDVPECRDAGGHDAAADEDAAIAAGEPLRQELLVRVRLRVAYPEAAIELVERGRAESTVRGAANGDLIVQAIAERPARIERAQRLVVAGVGRLGVPAAALCAGYDCDTVVHVERQLGKARRVTLGAASPRRHLRNPQRGEGRFDGFAIDQACFRAGDQRVRPQGPQPLAAKAGNGGGHPLDAVQCFGRAGGVDRGERLVVSLRPAEPADREQSSTDPAGCIKRHLPRCGGIGDGRTAVQTILIEHAAARVETPAVRRLVTHRHEPGPVFGCRLRIDRAARRDPGILLSRHQDVPVRGEPFAPGAVGPAACPAAAEQRHAAGRHVAAFEERASQRPPRTHGQDLHDPGHRVGAIQIAAAAALDFDAIDRRLRDLVPIDPAAERVVERDAIGQHQRSAGSRAAQAAKRDALSGRVRHARGRAAEEREPRHHLQGVVDRQGSRRQQFGCGDHGDRDRGIGPGDVGTRGGDVHGLEERRRFERDPQVSAVLRHIGDGRGKTGGRDDDAGGSGDVAWKREAAVGRRSKFIDGRSRRFEPDGGVRHGRSRGIQHDARDRRRRRLARAGNGDEQSKYESVHDNRIVAGVSPRCADDFRIITSTKIGLFPIFE